MPPSPEAAASAPPSGAFRPAAADSDCRLFWEVHVPLLIGDGKDTTIPGLTARVRFTIEGPGGGSWTVSVRGGRFQPLDDSPEPAGTTVTLSEEDFLGVVRGTVDHRQAFFQGRIRIEGDVPFILWASNLIPLLRDRFPFRDDLLRSEA